MHYPRSFNYIGDHIKSKRLDLRLTQKEIAEIIGVTPETVLNWEQGHITEPTLKHWPHIIRFLGYCPYVPCPTLSEKIAIWRKMEGIGSRQLAKEFGVDQRTYLKFESKEPLSRSSLDCITSGAANLVSTLNF